MQKAINLLIKYWTNYYLILSFLSPSFSFFPKKTAFIMLSYKTEQSLLSIDDRLVDLLLNIGSSQLLLH